MTQKHTPGIWAVALRQTTQIVIPERAGFNGRPYRIADSYFSNVGLANTPSIEEAKANARLIASAPDMLAALIEAESVMEALWSNSAARSEYGWDKSDDTALAQARTAIARAKGE